MGLVEAITGPELHAGTPGALDGINVSIAFVVCSMSCGSWGVDFVVTEANIPLLSVTPNSVDEKGDGLCSIASGLV